MVFEIIYMVPSRTRRLPFTIYHFKYTWFIFGIVSFMGWRAGATMYYNSYTYKTEKNNINLFSLCLFLFYALDSQILYG